MNIPVAEPRSLSVPTGAVLHRRQLSSKSGRYTLSFDASAGLGGSGGSSSSNSADGSVSGSQQCVTELDFCHLTQIPDAISSQVDAGIYSVHRCIQVWQKTLSLESEHYKSVLKVVEHEGTKADRASRDLATRTMDVWNQWQKQHIDMCKRVMEFNQRLSLHAVVPLLEFHSSAASKKKELDRDLSQKQKEVHQLSEAMNKELSQCLKLIEFWRQLKNEESEGGGAHGSSRPHSSSSPPPAPSSNAEKASALLSKLSTRLSFSLSGGSTASAVQDKLVQAVSQYTHALSAYNRRAELFHREELPQFLDQLGKIESQRLHVFGHAMRQWSNIQMEKSALLHEHFYSGSLGPQLLSNLNPSSDLDTIVNGLADVHGFAPAHSFATSYALPLTIEDIKAGRIEGRSDPVFHSNLVELMEKQNKSSSSSQPLSPRHLRSLSSVSSTSNNPADTDSIPRFLPLIMSSIRSADGGHGLEQEGIFRVSASADQVRNWKKKLDEVGGSQLKMDDMPRDQLHLSCALLKEFLRSMTEPVIPTSNYSAAIAMAKKHASSSAAGGNDISSPLTLTGAIRAEIHSWLSTLPTVNQRVLHALAHFMSEVVSERNVVSNRMSVENLAIVFAPCLLRNVSMDNAAEIMINSKFEVRFVAMLFRALAPPGSPPA